MLKKFRYGIKYQDGQLAEITVYANDDIEAEQQLQRLMPAGRIFWLESVEAMTGVAGGAD